VLKGKPARPMKKGRRVVAATCIVETGTEELMINNKGLQRGDPEEDDSGTSTPNSKPPATPANERLAGAPPVTSGPAGSAASPVLPSYPVGRGISLPFGQLLPKCDACSCNALITWYRRGNSMASGVVCLDHGLDEHRPARDLVFLTYKNRYSFISSEHEAAIRAYLGVAVKA